MTDIEQTVVRLLHEAMGIRADAVSHQKRLREDFGIDGDDAVAFMEAFAKALAVDMTGMKWDRHFGPEAGATPWTFLRGLWRGPSRRSKEWIPISVRDLIAAAQSKKWVMVYEDAAG